MQKTNKPTKMDKYNTMPIIGKYTIKHKGVLTIVSICGFEKQSSTEQGICLMDGQDDIKALFGSFIVNDNAVQRLLKGKRITVTASKSKLKGIIYKN